MLRISDTRIDGFIAEDVPYVDLTCAVLGIGDEPGEMEYFTREDCVLAGANGAARAFSPTRACQAPPSAGPDSPSCSGWPGRGRWI